MEISLTLIISYSPACGKTAHNLCSLNNKDENMVISKIKAITQALKLFNIDNYENGKFINYSFEPIINDYNLLILLNLKGSIN